MSSAKRGREWRHEVPLENICTVVVRSSKDTVHIMPLIAPQVRAACGAFGDLTALQLWKALNNQLSFFATYSSAPKLPEPGVIALENGVECQISPALLTEASAYWIPRDMHPPLPNPEGEPLPAKKSRTVSQSPRGSRGPSPGHTNDEPGSSTPREWLSTTGVLVATRAGTRDLLPSLSPVISPVTPRRELTPAIDEKPVPVTGIPDFLVATHAGDRGHLPSLYPTVPNPVAPIDRSRSRTRGTRGSENPDQFADRFIPTSLGDRTRLPSLHSASSSIDHTAPISGSGVVPASRNTASDSTVDDRLYLDLENGAQYTTNEVNEGDSRLAALLQESRECANRLRTGEALTDEAAVKGVSSTIFRLIKALEDNSGVRGRGRVENASSAERRLLRELEAERDARQEAVERCRVRML